MPDLLSTIKEPKTLISKPEPRSLAITYRRSASESGKRRTIPLEKSGSSVDTHVKKSSYQDVKSRYMEPKRPSIPNIKETLKVRARSSSGSSRTSSPVITSLRDGNANQTAKRLSDSTTMSRDSLASPAKKSDKLHTNRSASQQIDHERLSADSLGGSLHSSVITNKTISQESLVKVDHRQASHLKANNKNNFGAECDKQLPTAGKNAQLKVCSTLLSQTSSTVNSSTPSSMTVKSYLSSSNSINSPRDAVINRLTTPANQIPLKRNQEPKPPIKSFLSARSRQILAQKKSLSHSDSSKSVPAVIKEAANVPNAVNKSSSTSNILNQKTKIFPTTLHLRRSSKLNTTHQHVLSLPLVSSVKTSLMNSTKSGSIKESTPNNTNKSNQMAKERKHSSNLNENRTHVGNNNSGINDTDLSDSMPERRVESKLERSSTFCKDRSDINTNELEVIE